MNERLYIGFLHWFPLLWSCAKIDITKQSKKLKTKYLLIQFYPLTFLESIIVNQSKASDHKLANKIGFSSAILSTFLVAITTIASIIGIMGYYDTSLLQYTLWLVLAPTFVLPMLSIHNSSISSNRKILSGGGVAFILIYAVILRK